MAEGINACQGRLVDRGYQEMTPLHIAAGLQKTVGPERAPRSYDGWTGSIRGSGLVQADLHCRLRRAN